MRASAPLEQGVPLLPGISEPTDRQSSPDYTHNDMKTSLKLALPAVICLAFVAPAQAETGWVIRTGMPEAQMPAELAKWTGPPYNLQPVCVNGYEISGVARFSALYVEPTDDLEVLASFALTEAALSLTNSARQSTGYRLIWLNGFGYGTAARYNAIWKRTHGAAQQIRLGQTLAQHQIDDADLEAQDYKLAGVSSYNENGSPVHAGWWNYSPIATIITDVVYSRTAAQYQADFDAHPASSGWRLTSVSGYTVSGTERFTAMFKKLSGPAWSSIAGLNSTNFDAANNNAHYTGNRPAFLHTYEFGNTPHWNTVWQHDHGLAANWTDAIASEVRDYMATNSTPGLSLAITRNGRLIYASGFGFANTSTGEIVGPLHRFRMASVSKPFTAVAVLHALERYPGTLESFVFGSGALLGTTYGHNNYTTPQQAIRVRHLLTMTSSWVTDGKLWYDAEPSWGSDNGPAIDYQLDAYQQTSYMSPGDYAKYTNINFVTAARIVEVLSGQTYENYVKNQILAPCGVTDMAVGNRRKADRQTREVTYYPDVEDDGPYLIDPPADGRQHGLDREADGHAALCPADGRRFHLHRPPVGLQHERHAHAVTCPRIPFRQRGGHEPGSIRTWVVQSWESGDRLEPQWIHGWLCGLSLHGDQRRFLGVCRQSPEPSRRHFRRFLYADDLADNPPFPRRRLAVR